MQIVLVIFKILLLNSIEIYRCLKSGKWSNMFPSSLADNAKANPAPPAGQWKLGSWPSLKTSQVPHRLDDFSQIIEIL